MSLRPGSTLPPRHLLAVATERLFSGRTVVIVAHRLETVRTADEIMVVEAGQVVEHGRRGPGLGSGQPLLALLAAGSDSSGWLELLEEGRDHDHGRVGHLPDPLGVGQVSTRSVSSSA